MTRRHLQWLLASCLALALSACEPGYHKTITVDDEDLTAPDCDVSPNNNNISNAANSVFNLLANFTCDDADRDGVIMGQSAGFGNQIVSDNDGRSYTELFDAFTDETGHTPAMLSIDYEHDRIYTRQELRDANQKLRAHWNRRGLVTVSWMPLNPWTNNAEDPENSPGNNGQLAFTNAVDLAALLDTGSEMHRIWMRKLDHVADALADLRNEGIAVLWRPLPEMNNDTFWWGTQAIYNNDDQENASLYTELWQHMYRYFSNERELNNLLWVYSPAEGVEFPTDTDSPPPTDAPVDWAWPGDEWVDIVGAIVRDDQLLIPDYKALSDLNKPMGLAEYGPQYAHHGGAFTGNDDIDTRFDNRTYIDKLDTYYSFMSYWVTWHSFDDDASNITSHQALIHNRFSSELARKEATYSIERLRSRDLR